MADVNAYNNGFGDDPPALAEITSAFLRIRSGHDYGGGHGDFKMSEWAEAVAAAKALIEPLIYFGEVAAWIEYSIEERVVIRYVDPEAMGEMSGISPGVERSIRIKKITLTAAEKAEKLQESRFAVRLNVGEAQQWETP